MRIAHIVSTFPPYQGGMGNVCYYQAKELAELGHQVTVFTPWRGERFKITNEKFKIQYLWPLLKYGNAAFVPEIFIHLENFDLIHLHYPFIGGAEIIFFKKIFSLIPIILQYQMDLSLPGPWSLVSRLYNRSFNWWIIEKVEKIIVSSYDYAQSSKYLSYLLEKEKEKIIEIPHGVDTDWFKPREKDKKFLKKHHLSLKDKIILFVGGLDRAHYFKGLEVLLKAVVDLRSMSLDLRLLIVGEGNLRLKYEKEVEKLKIKDKVIFAGQVSREDLPTYYNLADLFVLPSINRNESFGLVLLEAMACAKPCLASDLPGVRTVVSNYKTGLLFKTGHSDDLAEKMKILLLNDDLAKKMGERGRERVEIEYDWKVIVKKLETLYGNVAKYWRK
ncbi:MAG: glycosyltransferase family 4 protein [Patescibacteria group bacterium]|nr:glycosyltransferase family 4 protein [Patescibacteria group bacterium]